MDLDTLRRPSEETKMRSRKIIVSLAGMLLCAAPLLVHAEIYQWIDAQGVTHYSGTPPSGHPYTEFASPEDDGIQMSSPGAQSASDATPAKGTTSAKSKQIPDLKQRCEIAQKDIQTLRSPRRIRVVKANGSIEWLNDSQRAAHLKQAQAFYNHFCSGN